MAKAIKFEKCNYCEFWEFIGIFILCALVAIGIIATITVIGKFCDDYFTNISQIDELKQSIDDMTARVSHQVINIPPIQQVQWIGNGTN